MGKNNTPDCSNISTITLVFIKLLSKAKNLDLTQKQIVDEVIDIKYIKYVSQIIVTDTSHK